MKLAITKLPIYSGEAYDTLCKHNASHTNDTLFLATFMPDDYIISNAFKIVTNDITGEQELFILVKLKCKTKTYPNKLCESLMIFEKSEPIVIETWISEHSFVLLADYDEVIIQCQNN